MMVRIRTAFAVCALAVATATAPLVAQEGLPDPDPLAAVNAGDWTSGAYRYDGAGNIVQIGTTQSPNTEGRPNHYIYDLRGRLVEGTGNTAAQNNTQSYSYDVYGNLTKVVTNGANTVSMGVDPLSNHIDKPTACAAGSTCVTGSFDAAGNQTSSSAGYGYKYDALSAMSELNGPQGRHEAYLYDDNGERVAFVADGGTTQTWRYTLRGTDRRVWRQYDDVVTGTQHAWSWVKDYVYRDAKLLASYKANGGGELAQHFHLDHLGSPRIITDDGGRRIATRTYMPYGEEAPGSSLDGEVMKFTGHERDIAPDGSVNALDYMHARYYGPVQARFLGVDPVLQRERARKRPDLWNRYQYAANSPVNYIDPAGRAVQLPTTCLNIDIPCKELIDIRNTVPPEQRMYVRVRAIDGQAFIDVRFLNAMRGSGSGNFQALRQVANSPGVVLFNSSVTSVQSKLGTDTIGTKSAPAPGALDTSGVTLTSKQSLSGKIEAYAAGDLDALETAKTTAHELRHARQMLLGLPYMDETAYEEYDTPTGAGMRVFPDPNGPVNIETLAAEQEVERNHDPFAPPFE